MLTENLLKYFIHSPIISKFVIYFQSILSRSCPEKYAKEHCAKETPVV